MKRIILLLMLTGCGVKESISEPSKWFYAQRAFPENTIPPEAIERAREQALNMRSMETPGVWELAGPTNIGGRVTAVAVNPLNTDEIFVGTADGGVFKSIDGGTSFSPIFDEVGILSIGAISIDPVDTSIVYVGTGEANSSGDSFDGNGIYASYDGGNTWFHLGLDSTAHIARIVVNPANDSIIYVAAMGRLFSTNPHRGLYRSRDRGATWERVLYINDTTGCIDVVLNPPDTVYAAMWHRLRGPDFRMVGGSGSGIFKSVDGGESWIELTTGLPTGSNVGRIGLAISQSNPSVLYAIYADHPGYLLGIFRSQDGGNTWNRVNSPYGYLYSSYGWYFGNIRVSPVDPDVVYVLGILGYVSSDGGNTWSAFTYQIHVDQHDLWIDPSNPSHMVVGNDGGVYITNNGGFSWQKPDLPITQFYDIGLDVNNIERIYGGTQDNGTVRTLTGSLDDWDVILWGDGFHVVVDYTNPSIIYAEAQYGDLHKSTDGGYTFYSVLNGIPGSDRRNWDTPFTMDPVNPDRLYYGTFRIFRTENGASRWYPVSHDLTNGPGNGNLMYGTITVIEVAPSDTDFIYAGTDDGNVWVSTNYCRTWRNISGSLPDRYVTDIAVDPEDPAHVFVSFSGYSLDEHVPYIFESYDTGNTWTDITGNLPQAPVNAIQLYSSHVIAGTDFGVFIKSNDLWSPLGSGLPMSVVMDLKIAGNYLVAGTHGRSTYRFDLAQIGVGEKSDLDGQIYFSVSDDRIVFPDSVLSFSIYDRQGRVVLKRSERHIVNIHHLPSGPYFVFIKFKNGRTFSGKFVKP